MNRIVLLASLLLSAFAGLAQKKTAGLVPTALSTEHRTNPLGLDAPKPRMSWQLTGSGRNLKQTAYALRVATDAGFKKKIWESGTVSSGESVLQAYGGPALTSGQRYYWQVRVTDGTGKTTDWSQPAWFETGLLAESDWKAKWIEPVQDSARVGGTPAPLLRKDFTLSGPIASARVYVTSHGYYELHLNGRKVGDEVLTPGWTVYPKRLQVQTYDVTTLLKPGANALGALLGEGWYRSRLGWENNVAFFGKTLGLLCQLHVRYANGREDWIVSDGSWTSTLDGPIRQNEIYDGESYDATREPAGWNQPGFGGTGWQPVREAQYPLNVLVAANSVPIRRIEEIKPIKLFRTPKGTLVADFGQNLVGWIRLNVSGPKGTTITLRHAEVLDKFGNFYLDNLRGAKVRSQYTLRGGGPEVYEPRFTFMGFRYASIEGWPGEPTPANLTAVVVHSAMTPTGTFECSNPLVNQLQKNIQWGQRGNFVDVPTDCPQRDERLGWTGDAQAFARTAAYNFDVAAFFTKWLQDVAADQGPDGAVPFVIPDVLKKSATFPTELTSAGWGDVAVIAPWTMYQVYGDRALLERQYPSMKAYVEYIHKKAGTANIWRGGSIFGDWLYFHPRETEHTLPDGHTDKDYIATTFYAYSTSLLAKAAEALGKTAEAAEYRKLFDSIKQTVNEQYVTPSGRIASDSQTSYVLALLFDLLPDAQRTKAAQNLVADIKARGNHLSTGFLGTPYLCHVLSDNGFANVAYDLLFQETYPSWLYPVKMGATTIWERWDGQKPDSTFQDVGMNSFNHYAYGAIGDWMYRVVAGLEIGKPGYQHVVIKPVPSEKLTYAKATYRSGYGEIASGWERANGVLTMNVTIPPNTTATVYVPAKTAEAVSEGDRPLTAGEGMKIGSVENGYLRLDVGSGQYRFAVR
jgi:alpha-L-rhamnosidase